MPRRHSAASRIQNNWRIYLAKCELYKKRKEWEKKDGERKENLFMNSQAIKIQSLWRGFMVRKETNHIIGLNKIRDRLSFYIQSSSTSVEQTLGARIHNSLATLSFQNVSIQQIIIALIDLEKVTRLSPECCRRFIREGAPETLYLFMQNCNRSVPHMDLIKLCLQIFINLAKYNETVCQVLQPQTSLSNLINLIQSYQSSNPVIFMDVCVLFILLAQNEPLAAHLLNQETFVKKLQSLHTVLERRVIFKKKSLNYTSVTLSGNANLNTSSIMPSTSGSSSSNVGNHGNTPNLLAIPNKKGIVSVSFSMTPDWSLQQKKTIIELPDQLSALEYLLNTLNIKYEKEICVTGTKTPIKSKANSLFRNNDKDTLSSSKSNPLIAKSSQCSKTARSSIFKNTASSLLKSAHVGKSSSATNFQKASFIPIQKTNLKILLDNLTLESSPDNFESHILGDESSVGSSDCMLGMHDMTVKSMASFIEEPKMNSTIMVSNADSTLTFAHGGQGQSNPRSNVISNEAITSKNQLSLPQR